MRKRICLVLVAMVMVTCGRAWAQQSGGQPSHVQASAVANVTGVTAGSAFKVGVLLKIDPGWHVYWTNPGETGLPTLVKWTLPEGFSVGEVRYPTPHRFVLPGDIVCYGYEGSVMLIADVTPGASVESGSRVGIPFDLQAKVSWLVCADVCLPGRETVDLKLPNMAGGAVNGDLFDFWEKQVPVDAGRSPDIESWTVRPLGHDESGGVNYELNVVWKFTVPETIDFLPGALEGYALENVHVEKGDKKARVTFHLRPLAGKHDLSTRLDAVVGYNHGSEWRGVSVSFAISKF